MHNDYAPRMRRLPRPTSTFFRATLAMAMLAWTALAFGMSVISPSGGHAPMSGPHTQFTETSSHCHGMTMASAGSHLHPAPAVPMGHGDCCHAGCHCLSACNAVLVVPASPLGLLPPGAPAPTPLLAHVRPAGLAPPLRPPIA